jgi:hypothetical protein
MQEICSVGCTGCRECERVGGPEGFYVRESLASIDYNRGGDRSYAAGRCPMNCIIKFEQNEKNSFKLWRFWSTLITGGKESG